MKNGLGTITVSLLLVTAAPALAAPATVNLRVEGDSATYFEGAVTTDAKTLTKDSSGPHECDGTNGGQGGTPGPTMTTALDDGVGSANWDGTWFSFGDFGIDRIGPDASDNTNFRYWGYAYNWQASNVGGCQQRVVTGDEVLFAYDFFSKTYLLRLAGPAKAATGEAVTVTVTDGGTAAPMAAATVGGKTTDATGQASLSFDTPGMKRLKAERADSVRSNALDVCVYVPDSGECGTTKPGEPPPPPPAAPAAKDTTPPAVALSLRDGATYSRGPRVLAGRADDTSGLWGVYLRVSKLEPGAAATRCRWFSGRLERFTRSRPCAKARFIRLGRESKWSYLLPERLKRGSYVVEVKALDRSLNRGAARAAFRVR